MQNLRYMTNYRLLLLSSVILSTFFIKSLYLCHPQINKIGKVYSLKYTDIPKVSFNLHVGHCCTVIQGIVVQKCVPTMTLGHSFTNVATRTVESQGCPGLVANAAERWPMRQSSWSNNCWGASPNRVIILGKSLGSKAPGVK
jgi:hypothetical protein